MEISNSTMELFLSVMKGELYCKNDSFWRFREVSCLIGYWKNMQIRCFTGRIRYFLCNDRYKIRTIDSYQRGIMINVHSKRCFASYQRGMSAVESCHAIVGSSVSDLSYSAAMFTFDNCPNQLYCRILSRYCRIECLRYWLFCSNVYLW